ncbi:unnamed protein product, partial [Effrenium voratum]
AKAKALLTSMSGAMNSYVAPKAASVATSAAPQELDKCRRQRHRQLQMQLQMLQMQMQGLWQFPQMQLLSYLMCLAKQKASRSSLFRARPRCHSRKTMKQLPGASFALSA